MEKIIKEEVKYNGPRFNVVQKIYERDDGKQIIRDTVNPGDASVILPITNNNEVIFVCQYRESVGKVCTELPAGIVDPGEEPIDTAKRELEEETGLVAKNVEYMLTMLPSTGYTSERVHIFLARNFESGQIHLDDDEEILEIKKIPIEECVNKAVNGELANASQIIAILLYKQKYMN